MSLIEMKRRVAAMPIASCSLAVLVIAACSSVPRKTERVLAAPVNCETAEDDLLALAAGLPSGPQKARAVVTTLVPAGLALGVVTRDLRDRAKVVSGRLESEIYEKMADIYDECGLVPIEESQTGDESAAAEADGAAPSRTAA